METLGVFVLTFGVWLIYSGIKSIRPIKMIEAIIADPSNASVLINDAVAKAQTTGAVIEGTGTMTNGLPLQAGVNPFASYPVTTGFHEVETSGTLGRHVHQGIDYGMPSGTSLPAIMNGTATYSNGVNSGGAVTITGSGAFTGYTAIYMHVRKSLIKSGQTVELGQIIAQSGGGANDPGKGDATGPHLHLEIHHLGAPINPNSFFTWAAANAKNENKDDSFFGFKAPTPIKGTFW